jgi:hypothetical protein
MSEINIVLRTADKTKKAEIILDTSNTGADVIQAAADNWSLPTDTDYSLVNISKGTTIVPSSTLGGSGVETNDILEVQPVLVAG